MDSGQLDFRVVKPKISWGTYFQDLLKPRFGGGASESLGFESYSGRDPSVIAENSSGETRVIAVVKKFQEARDKAAKIESDFRTLGAATCCERYNVPPEFVSG
jgi:hypothetical protein